jgi:hypothetical protein
MRGLQYIKRSPALIVSLVALVAATAGTATATSGSGHATSGTGLAPRAHAAKHVLRGPRGFRGRRGFIGPQGPKGAAGAAGAQGAPGAPGATGPSDGFVNSRPAAVGLPAGADTVVAQLSLTPASNYIVTAATELGNTSSSASDLVSCTLLENFNPIGGGSADLPALAAFAQTVTLTAATTGGTIKLSCNPASAGQARNSVITAIKVGALHTQ